MSDHVEPEPGVGTAGDETAASRRRTRRRTEGDAEIESRPLAEESPPAPAPQAPPAAGGTGDFDVDREIDALSDLDAGGYRQLVTSRVTALVANLPRLAPRMAICAGIGIAFGWLANVLTMAGKYDGFVVPPGSTASGQGNIVRGASFWFVASMVLSAVANHRVNAGSERFWNDVRAFPDTLRGLVRNDDASMVHALWGFAGATVITYTLGPSLSGAVAVGVVVAVGTMFRPVLVGGLLLGWRWVVKKIAPQSPNRAGVQAVTVSTLGGAAAMGLAVLVTGSGTRLILGIGAAVFAVALSQRKVPSAGAAAIVFGLVGVGAFVVLGAEAALADDGGWRECGSSLSNWWNCSGSDRARWLAIYGAGASGLGGALGAGFTGNPDLLKKSWSEMTDEERQSFKDDYVRRFIETHPNATPEQIQRFREGLDAREPGFWEKAWEFAKDFGNAYWEDLASGKQAEGLGGMFYGMGEGVSKAAKATWSELMQLDDTMAEFGGVFWDDIASGAQRDRLKGMLEYGGEALGKAEELLHMSPEELSAAFDKYGKENVEKFMAKMGEFERALANADPTEIRRKIGEIAGMAEFEVLMGGATDKLGAKALLYLDDIKMGKYVDEAVDGLRGTAKGVTPPKLSDDLLFERHNLLELAKQRPVKLSAEEASRLFGIDEEILLQRQGTILQYGEGAAEKGAFSQYKLGDENAVIASRLRTEHPEIWTGKWNPVGDKSYVPGEEAFMSADDLRRFQDNPPLPGETVNYKPRALSAEEVQALPPELQSRYNDRMKDATAWDKHTGYDARKSIDYNDPAVRAKYGEMFVPEDPSAPVKAAEFWKDPTDNRVYVRYQTKDGTWSAPRRQASDVDTVTHGGGDQLTYEQSRDLQYKQSGGQIGEGDTPAWLNSMLEPSGSSYALKDPAMKDSLYKALDALHKADGEQVIEQTLDGYYLKTADYSADLLKGKQAAAAADAAGLWTEAQRNALVGKGLLPPR